MFIIGFWLPEDHAKDSCNILFPIVEYKQDNKKGQDVKGGNLARPYAGENPSPTQQK